LAYWGAARIASVTQIRYFTAGETELPLSNLVGNEAAELRFELEDATEDSSALKAVTDRLDRQWKKHPAMMPQVEALPCGLNLPSSPSCAGKSSAAVMLNHAAAVSDYARCGAMPRTF
jgi:hypothetical protein